MKKKLAALLVTAVLAIATLAGCGKDKGITVAVPNDTTNEARALLLLEELGYITLKEGAGITATVRDIAENPYNLTFNEVEAAQLPNVLQDVDYAVINSNYAIEADLVPAEDAIALESADNNPYVNIIAVRSEDKDKEEIKTLVEVLHSKEIQDFINENYKGSVIPSNK